MKLLEIEKDLAKQRQLSGKTLRPNDLKGQSRDIVSKQIGLSPRTFERAKVIIQKAPEELKIKRNLCIFFCLYYCKIFSFLRT